MMKRLDLWNTVLVVGMALILTVGMPRLVSLYSLVEVTVMVALAVFAISQGFIWGFGGIQCFGQAAFFGLGGYTYAVAAINLGNSSVALMLGVVVPIAFAGVLGYFMFYGRITDTYVGVITLTVSVILFDLFNATSADIYRVGNTPLGGFNGIPSIPGLTAPGSPDVLLTPEQFWYVSMVALIACYVLLRLLLASRFGRVVVAIRENETRATLLGYDSRRYKTLTFMIGAGIAGLGGCLYANWGNFISPTVFALSMSAQSIIYVLVGGVGTLVGPVLGAIAVQFMMSYLGTQQVFNAQLILGLVLIVFVLLVPQGVLPAVRSVLTNLVVTPWQRRSRAVATTASIKERS